MFMFPWENCTRQFAMRQSMICHAPKYDEVLVKDMDGAWELLCTKPGINQIWFMLGHLILSVTSFPAHGVHLVSASVVLSQLLKLCVTGENSCYCLRGQAPFTMLYPLSLFLLTLSNLFLIYSTSTKFCTRFLELASLYAVVAGTNVWSPELLSVPMYDDGHWRASAL